MSIKSMLICLILVTFIAFGWKLTSSSAYESAEYKVLEKEKPYEIREYPDLMMASTSMPIDRRQDDGSFMRLFRYISGANAEKQKVAMTTPVFMEANAERTSGEMGFVLPKEVASGEIPQPTGERVEIRKREGGRFAVIQFNGRMNREAVIKAEQSLRAWLAERNLKGEPNFESAGYDPPWKPGRFRRNEVLIRLSKPEAGKNEEQSTQMEPPETTSQSAEQGQN